MQGIIILPKIESRKPGFIIFHFGQLGQNRISDKGEPKENEYQSCVVHLPKIEESVYRTAHGRPEEQQIRTNHPAIYIQVVEAWGLEPQTKQNKVYYGHHYLKITAMLTFIVQNHVYWEDEFYHQSVQLQIRLGAGY